MASNARYDAKQLAALGEQAQADGLVILREHFPREKMKAWAEAFRPLLTEFLSRQTGEENRGANRHYITLPFQAPFADPELYEDEAVLSIVEHLVGKDPVMCQLASDTPLKGSDYQEIHRDAPPLFPEWEGHETPSFQLAVNFPLVDMTLEMGPFEVARGTHRLTRAEGMAMIEAGEVKLEKVTLNMGDVMIRDVRGLHRGTPNTTDTPRPMVVIGYSRKWLHRPEVNIRIPRAMWETLSPRGKHLLRYNPIVESLADAPAEESYKAFAY
jgi:ectoine hydroxylase-related dioxygenase (phytanoyl-CoA dioxygenase family)